MELLAGDTEASLKPIPNVSTEEQDYWSGQIFALATFLDHREWIGGMAFTPDSRWLASGSGYAGQAAEVRIWDMKTLRGKGE